jgi:hypothetical protein
MEKLIAMLRGGHCESTTVEPFNVAGVDANVVAGFAVAVRGKKKKI